MKRLTAFFWVLLWASSALPGKSGQECRELQPGDRPTRPGEILFVSHLELDEISLVDLTGGQGSSTIDLGAWRPTKLLNEVAPVNLRVTRPMPTVWRVRLDGQAPAAVDVRYEVFGIDGTPQRLTHVSKPEEQLGVIVEPLPPHLLEDDGAGAVLEGGFVLQISLDQTRLAGEYSGTVVVSVNSY